MHVMNRESLHRSTFVLCAVAKTFEKLQPQQCIVGAQGSSLLLEPCFQMSLLSWHDVCTDQLVSCQPVVSMSIAVSLV